MEEEERGVWVPRVVVRSTEILEDGGRWGRGSRLRRGGWVGVSVDSVIRIW